MEQNYYNNQGYQPPPSNGKSVAALVCGIVGIIGGWIPVVQYFTLVLSIIAVVLGVQARTQAQGIGAPTGMATAGMVLGIVALAFSVLGIICVLCTGAAIMGALGSI